MHSPGKPDSTCCRGPVLQSVHFHGEVVLQEEEADNREEVDQDECQHCREYDGATIASHTLDDIEQRLFSVHQVKELQCRNTECTDKKNGNIRTDCTNIENHQTESLNAEMQDIGSSNAKKQMIESQNVKI